MRVVFRITHRLLQSVRADLARPHSVAAERVGFLSCGVAALRDDGLLVLAGEYHVVHDADYLDDPRVGAMVGAEGFRKVLQIAYNRRISMWHVHRHDHRGRPRFSGIDREESAAFVPDFWHVRPERPHGTLLLSRDALDGLCWVPGVKDPVRLRTVTVVGAPVIFSRSVS